MKVEINSEEKHKIVSIFKTYATIKEKCRSLIFKRASHSRGQILPVLCETKGEVEFSKRLHIVGDRPVPYYVKKMRS